MIRAHEFDDKSLDKGCLGFAEGMEEIKPEPQSNINDQRESVRTPSKSIADESKDASKSSLRITDKSVATRSLLDETLKNTEYVRYMDEVERDKILDGMYKREVSAGEVLYVQGDHATNMYIIESGEFQEIIDDKAIRVLERGKSISVEAMHNPFIQDSTIIALNSGTLWIVEIHAWRRVRGISGLSTVPWTRSVLLSIPKLKGLTDEDLEAIGMHLKDYSYAKGSIIVKEGEFDSPLSIIEYGEAVVTKDGLEIQRLLPGDYFGVEALFDEPAPYTITAVKETNCIEIYQGHFLRYEGLTKILEQNE